MHQRVLKLQAQQASGRRPTTETARLLGSLQVLMFLFITDIYKRRTQVVLVHSMNECKGSRSVITLLILALDGGEWSASRSGHFNSAKKPGAIEYETVWVPQKVWKCWRWVSWSCRASKPNFPVCSQVTIPITLCRLLVLTGPINFIIQTLYKNWVTFLMCRKAPSLNLVHRRVPLDILR